MFKFTTLEHSVCQEQGRLFELSLEKGYDSVSFIEFFMRSETVYYMDIPYEHMNFTGQYYLLENLEDEKNFNVQKSKNLFSADCLYWIGYLYRFWHYYTGEKSPDIYKQADAKTMAMVYPSYHALSCQDAVDRLKEDYKSNNE